jgi:hypothetical protein
MKLPSNLTVGDQDMKTRNVGLSRFVAAASATVITAISAWAFVSSSASIERDPFQFASVMAANAKLHVAQVQSRTASTCPNNPEVRDPRAPMCLGG